MQIQRSDLIEKANPEIFVAFSKLELNPSLK